MQELIEGKSLAQMVEAGWQPDQKEVERIAKELLTTFSYLQEQKVHHSLVDVCPRERSSLRCIHGFANSVLHSVWHSVTDCCRSSCIHMFSAVCCCNTLLLALKSCASGCSCRVSHLHIHAP